MFEKTGLDLSPWTVVKGDIREQGRKEAMRYILASCEYEGKGETGVSLTIDSQIVSFKKSC